MDNCDWDSALPRTVADVVALLERRVEVHEAWRVAILSGCERAREAVDRGVGTAESHETYARQYRAAIGVLNGRLSSWSG